MKYGITDKISFNHQVLKAKWLNDISKWEIEVKYQDTGIGAGENDVTGYLKEVRKVDLEFLHKVWDE